MRRVGGRRKGNKSRKDNLLEALPHDLIVEFVARVASSSENPVDDVMILRATCKSFYEASKAKKVGQSIAVKNMWAMHWWTKKRYFRILEHCAGCGNAEANFILGLEELFNCGKSKSGLDHLLSGIGAGHPTAAYITGILLLRNPSTHPLAMELLNNLAADGYSGDSHIAGCRKAALSVVRKIMWNAFMRDQWLIQRQPCPKQLCGRTITGGGIGSCLDGGSSGKNFLIF